MSHLGSFSPEALEAFQAAVVEDDVNFAEGDVYDFTRCVRADGSHYGTGGTCRKGTETGEKEKSWSPPTGKKRPPENPTAAQITAMSNDELWDGKATYKPGTAGHQAYKNEIERRRQKDENLKKRGVEPKKNDSEDALGKVKIVSAETAKKMSDAELKSQMENANKAAFSKGSNLSPEVMKGLKEQHDIARAELARRGTEKTSGSSANRSRPKGALLEESKAIVQQMKGAKGLELVRLKNKLAELKGEMRKPLKGAKEVKEMTQKIKDLQERSQKELEKGFRDRALQLSQEANKLMQEKADFIKGLNT